MKNIFVLYEKSGLASGRRLGTELIRLSNAQFSFVKGRKNRYLELKRHRKFDYVINVGWPGELPVDKNTVVLNKPGIIAESSNKRKARIKFKELGIPAPQLWMKADSIPDSMFPVVGRTTTHTQGRGFWFCKNKKEAVAAQAKGATHFLKFIEDTREFRVHVAAPRAELSGLKPDDYVVVKLSEKLPREGAKSINNIIKNHDNGWVFAHPEDSSSKAIGVIRQVGRETIAKFGLHWGAVDIILSKYTNEPYVLEINSAPCLTDENSNTIDKYVDIMRSLVGMNPPLERRQKEVVTARAVIKKPQGKDHVRALLNRLM